MKRYAFPVLTAVLLVVLTWGGCDTGRQPLAPSPEPAPQVAAKQPAAVAAAIAVQDRHTDRLMAIRGVVGTATGLARDGRAAIIVFAEGPGIVDLPMDLEGIPVDVAVTGTIVALAVHLDVSTGNAKECAAGTIGARVMDSGGKVYALSNNHVYARENKAKIGEKIVSPGLYDTGCIFNSQNVIGTLAKFVKIQFGRTSNTIDAAIALSAPDKLGNATPPPPDGYGIPNSTTATAWVGQLVQKYGRTTGLTRGSVNFINVTVWVQYSSGRALFADQIAIGPGGFSGAGDSGSLIVTDDGKAHPIGLLFAGSSTLTIANRIQNVLTALNVTIDGTN